MLNKLRFWIILSPLILSFVIILTIISVLRFLPDKLPLFYSAPWGEEQLATHGQFLIIPATIVIVTLLNLVISWQLHNQQSFFKNALILQSLLVSLILTVTFIKIILLFV